ncbi:MAG: diguanylate cyclase [bacterium]
MKKKILLIDDSATQLMSLKITLVKAGYEVVTAINGVEGISAVYKHRPDLIVSDIIMPEINGYQLCRLLKNEPATKSIPIILLTSLNEKLDKFWGLRAGANAFVIKDQDFAKLIAKIQYFIEKNDKEHQGQSNSIEEDVQYASLQSRINQILDESLIETTIINEFRNLTEYALDTAVLCKHILGLLGSILDYDIAGIFFNDRDEKKIKKVYFSTNTLNSSEETLSEIKHDFFYSVLGEEYASNRDFISFEIAELSDESQFKIENTDQLKSKVCIPIIYSNKIIGGICFYHNNSNKFSQSRILKLIIEELKILMRFKWLNSETKYLAITDALTGLYNRRYFQQSVEREFARAKRYNTMLSIAMLDIDFFKKINDTYGHQFGDKVISEVSNLIKTSLRKTDYIARYGGEEFIAIVPETSIENAYIPFERLRKKVEDFSFKFEDKIVKVTISIGIAEINKNFKTEAELIEKADQALYLAKQTGRNKVEIYKQEG